jgi:hypothetical protein
MKYPSRNQTERTDQEAAFEIDDTTMGEIAKAKQIDPMNVYFFRPQKDITAYELAQVIKLWDLYLHYTAMLKIPESMRRHFVGAPRATVIGGEPSPRGSR